MKIDVKSLVNILRYPMLSETAKKVLQENGFTPVYKQKKLSSELAVHLAQADKGIELAFSERKDFESDFAPVVGDGDAIFTCMFIYPNGTEDFGKFESEIGFGIENCRVRGDALIQLGKPEITREDDGVIEWDRWIVGEHLSIRADYKENKDVLVWTIGVPMIL